MANAEEIRARVAAVKRDCSVYELAARFTDLEAPRPTRKSVAGLCPLHAERTPSFHVYVRTNTWWCFGCHQGGDVIDLVRKCLNLSFFEALAYLEGRSISSGTGAAYRACMHAPPLAESGEGREGTEDPANHARRTREGRAALTLATDLYAHALWDTPRAQRYLAQRGIPEEMALRWRLGYATGHQLLDALRRYHIPLATAFDLGLLAGQARQPFERFAGRLVIPELRHDRPIWLTGRRVHLKGEPAPAKQIRKYINTTGTRVLGGAMTVAGQLAAVVCEGPFDWLTLLKWRFPACYLAGDGIPTELLSWVSTARIVYLAMDPDAAGDLHLPALRHVLGERACTVRLPPHLDPGDLGVCADGYTRFHDCLLMAARRFGAAIEVQAA